MRIANSSGQVGRNLTDTVGFSMSGFVPALTNLPRHNSDGIGGMHVYVPWWLYEDKKKDFPHTLGMMILVGAFAAATACYTYYQIFWAWVFLLGSFAFDAVLYLLVADVVTCYRCNAEHRGVPSGPHHLPHEQTTQEKYRQEKIRMEELERAARG